MFLLYNFSPHWKKSALPSLVEDDIEITHMDPPLQDSEIDKKEVDKYRAIPQASMMDNPLQFWKERSFDFPNLIVLAEEYLCVQASSVAAERVFSTSGDIVSSTRACLRTDQVDALVFLKKKYGQKMTICLAMWLLITCMSMLINKRTRILNIVLLFYDKYAAIKKVSIFNKS